MLRAHPDLPDVVVYPGFLDSATCRRIRGAMDDGVCEPAEVLGGDVRLDTDVRRALVVDVDAATLALVESRLDGLREDLAECFRCALIGREGAGFLRYGPGDFYRPHRDRGTVPSWPAAVRRRVSIVVFLNSARERPGRDEFSGGSLHLIDATRAGAITPAEGCLVAFPADVLHEVTPVAHGHRDTLVDWFLAPPGRPPT